MSTALLFGFPQKYVGKAKSITARESGRFGGWDIKYLTANGGVTGPTKKDLDRIPTFAEQHQDLHIIGFSQEKNRSELANQIAPYFRFRWFDYGLIGSLTSPDPSAFVEELADILAEEAEWALRVKPPNIESPLLLPQCAFKCDKRNAELWRHALAYGDIENIIGAEKAVEAFRSSHHRKVIVQNSSKYKWVDEVDRIFDDNGARHGQAQYPRNWKYSYRNEMGFHYDVTNANGQRFAIIDFENRSHSVNRGAHANIDPHGYVRG